MFFEKQGRVGIVTLSRPEARNAWDADFSIMALELTEDKTEGHQAWREKRTPVFPGR